MTHFGFFLVPKEFIGSIFIQSQHSLFVQSPRQLLLPFGFFFVNSSHKLENPHVPVSGRVYLEGLHPCAFKSKNMLNAVPSQPVNTIRLHKEMNTQWVHASCSLCHPVVFSGLRQFYS